ncbi:MAG: hypothetical protein OK455_02985 [Thaumarchaeota archaeon]|nr:hypothetical protein [Nitrososphaerota archaeon]
MSGPPMEDRRGDLAFLLYATPFIINLVYAVYLWAGAGLSSTLPQLVFLEVTQSPYIFLLGFAAVMFGAVLDLNSAAPERTRNAVIALSKRLQAIAVISIVLALVTAWYAAGFDLGTTFFNVLDGRYPLVVPALLVLFSFLILPAVRFQGANIKNLLIVVLLIGSPAALYEIGKRNTIAGLGIGLILLILAAFLLVRKKD